MHLWFWLPVLYCVFLLLLILFHYDYKWWNKKQSNICIECSLICFISDLVCIFVFIWLMGMFVCLFFQQQQHIVQVYVCLFFHIHSIHSLLNTREQEMFSQGKEKNGEIVLFLFFLIFQFFFFEPIKIYINSQNNTHESFYFFF